MDDSGRKIPWVEDDQGEGIKDMWEEYMKEVVQDDFENPFLQKLREPWRKNKK